MKYKARKDLFVGISLITVGFLIGRYINFDSKTIPDKDFTDNKFVNAEQNINPIPKTLIEEKILTISTPINPSLYTDESNFTKTIRSCLGPECFDSRPGQSSIDRVGILALPGSGVQAMLIVLRKASRKVTPKFELVLDTHVPAYGYGKNHGWTRIVRVVRNILPHAYSLLLGRHSPMNQGGGNNSRTITTSAMQTQVRQLVRWHCRLSHVAAHTKMLSVFLEDVFIKPVVEMEKLITFIGLPMLRPELLVAVSEMDLSGFQQDVQTIPLHLREAGFQAINDELISSNGLTQWPCKNFRELDNGPDSLPLSSRDLAANCSSPFVKCTVGYDRKEQTRMI